MRDPIKDAGTAKRAKSLEASRVASPSASAPQPVPESFPFPSWQAAFDALTEPAWLMDVDCRILACNQAARTLYGNEIIGRHCWEVVHETEQPVSECPLPCLRLSERRESAELLLKGRWFDVSVDPLFDKQGNLSGAVHIMRDITRQKLAEKELQKAKECFGQRVVERTNELETALKALRENESNFRVFFENVAVGAVQINEQGHFIRVNDRICEITGYSREELLNGMGLLDLDHPEDREADQKNITQLIFKSEGYKTDKRYVAKDGHVLWVHITSTAVSDAHGRFTHSAVVIEDISLRKQAEEALRRSEERYRMLFERANEGIAILSDQGELLSVNQTFARMHGYQPEEMLHMHVKDLDTPESARKVPGRIRRLIAGESLTFEVEHYHKDGHFFPLEVSSNLISTGEKPFIQSFFRDITNRKQREERITRLQRVKTILSGVESAIIHAKNRRQLLVECCRIAVKKGGFKLAWIGMVTTDGTVQPVASVGDIDYLEVYRPVIRNVPEGRGPVGTAIRKNRPVIIEDVDRHKTADPWLELAREFGMCYVAAFPLRISNKVAGSFQVYAPRPNFFDRDEVNLLTQVSREISFALTAMDVVGKRQQAERELRKSERELADFFVNSPVGLLWVGADGRLLRANQAGLSLLGYNARAILGKPVGHFHVDAEAATVLLDRLATGETVHNYHTRIRQKDGNILHVLVDANGFREKQRMVHSRWFVRDITRRVELEREVLAAAEQERQRLGQDLHDDLCQQLTGIHFLSEALARSLEGRTDTVAADAREIVQLARNAVNQAREMSHGLSPLQMDAEGLMEGLKNLTAHTRKVFRRECSFHCSEPVLIADHNVALHLYRIAQEAVNNAIKHGKADRIEIGLRADNRNVTLAVRDYGLGLPKTTERNKGMGLRVMQYRAGLIGGSLVVQRQPDSGTEVVCTVRDGLLPTETKNLK